MTVNEKGLEAAQVAAREGCGLFIESQHVFCDDPVVGEAADGYGKPLRQPYCSCKGDAERIIKAYLRASSNDAEQWKRPADDDIDAAWLNLLEKDDRSSPEEYPEQALISKVELTEIVASITSTDAERWRALMSSPKMHFMGSAGFEHVLKADAPPGSRVLEHQIAVPKADGYWHFGMEFWYGIPADDRYPDTFERQMLTAYVDAIRLSSKQRSGE